MQPSPELASTDARRTPAGTRISERSAKDIAHLLSQCDFIGTVFAWATHDIRLCGDPAPVNAMAQAIRHGFTKTAAERLSPILVKALNIAFTEDAKPHATRDMYEVTEAGRDALGLREALIVALEAADQLFELAEAWEAARRSNGLEPVRLDVIQARLRMARLAVEQHVGPSWPLKPSQLFPER